MSTFLLEIITPEKVAFSDQVSLLTAVSASGVIGILPHHVPLFSRLIEGELKITKGSEESFLAIGGGFIEVTPQKVVVLVTSAFQADELDEKEILEAKKRAEQALIEKPTGQELKEAQVLLRRSNVSLKVLQHKKYPGIKKALPLL